MSGRASAPSDERKILDCISSAEASAGSDGDFRRLLNEAWVASGGAPALARRGGRSRAAPALRSPNDDPRCVSNGRELARQAGGGNRIVGGTPVPKGLFLDCVAVGNDARWGCTGTLVASDVVVTAGHCAGFATRVFFGSDVSKQGKVVAVRERVPHPDYTNGVERNDLMVLLLATPVENIPPRPVAAKTTVDGAMFGRVVGFGNTDAAGMSGYGVKLQVDVPIASPACAGTVDGEVDSIAYGCHADREIVAGKPLLAKDSCTGDSGGPFYLDVGNDAWVLAGATSRATNQATSNCGDGGIYVRLDAYRDWIAAIPGVTLP